MLLLVGGALGIPALILQRWVATTRLEAIILVAGWFLLIGVAVAVLAWRRRGLRTPVLVAYGIALVGTLAIGYWTGFRDMVVNEDVAVASMRAEDSERQAALRGSEPRAAGPVEVAGGTFAGADGHAAAGVATVIARADGSRVLTFTDFDVDPGLDVDVYLAPGTGGIDDGLKVGDLKGNVGDQQYELPAEADLRRLRTVILWCNPFTVRIAVADLRP